MKLEIENLSKNYTQGTTELNILSGLNLKMESGQSLAVVGESGSGKSTLLSLLAGLDRPDSGSIRIDGDAIEGLSEEKMCRFRARNIGIVFQQFHLISTLTALENVSLPMEFMDVQDYQEKSLRALEQVGLGERKDHFPSQLSGGECQRVAIARALVVNPKLLLADEPSGNLDEATGSQVMDLFFDLTKRNGASVILVTHNERLAQRCDLQKRLKDGVLQ